MKKLAFILFLISIQGCDKPPTQVISPTKVVEMPKEQPTVKIDQPIAPPVEVKPTAIAEPPEKPKERFKRVCKEFNGITKCKTIRMHARFKGTPVPSKR